MLHFTELTELYFSNSGGLSSKELMKTLLNLISLDGNCTLPIIHTKEEPVDRDKGKNDGGNGCYDQMTNLEMLNSRQNEVWLCNT